MLNSELIGSSARFRAVLDQVNTVAATNCTVLLQGETGTGKEVIAQAIHQASPRSRHRFVALNCAAIPAALLESELFGHERGAFTGAVAQSVGRFQLADRGTLFLDEIGELPLELQPKLLRALQEREVERLGGSRSIPVDVRIIAATNQDLAALVQARQFRPDLYYRLNVVPIELPPLRERIEDIPPLVEHFVRKFARQMNKPVESVPEDVMEIFKAHDWPGNIRELQNVVERGMVMTIGPVLSRETADRVRPAGAAPRRAPVTAEPASIKTLADAERAHIVATLQRANWVIGGANGAAAQLGLPRTTLLCRMQRLGISNPASRRRLIRVVHQTYSHFNNQSAGNLRVAIPA